MNNFVINFCAQSPLLFVLIVLSFSYITSYICAVTFFAIVNMCGSISYKICRYFHDVSPYRIEHAQSKQWNSCSNQMGS